MLITADSIISGTDAKLHSLVGTGLLDKAAIFNTQGTSVWASSPGFTVCRQFLLTPFTYITRLIQNAHTFKEAACGRRTTTIRDIDDPVRSRRRK